MTILNIYFLSVFETKTKCNGKSLHTSICCLINSSNCHRIHDVEFKKSSIYLTICKISQICYISLQNTFLKILIHDLPFLY